MFCSSTYFDDSGKNNRVPHWAHLIIGRDANFVVSLGLKVTGGSSGYARGFLVRTNHDNQA
jgi:hypothetical protein